MGLTLGSRLVCLATDSLGSCRAASWAISRPWRWRDGLGIGGDGRDLGQLGRRAHALILKRLGFDPALMSNPMISSLVDVTGIIAYFGIAKWILM